MRVEALRKRDLNEVLCGGEYEVKENEKNDT